MNGSALTPAPMSAKRLPPTAGAGRLTANATPRTLQPASRIGGGTPVLDAVRSPPRQPGGSPSPTIEREPLLTNTPGPSKPKPPTAGMGVSAQVSTRKLGLESSFGPSTRLGDNLGSSSLGLSMRSALKSLPGTPGMSSSEAASGVTESKGSAPTTPTWLDRAAPSGTKTAPTSTVRGRLLGADGDAASLITLLVFGPSTPDEIEYAREQLQKATDVPTSAFRIGKKGQLEAWVSHEGHAAKLLALHEQYGFLPDPADPILIVKVKQSTEVSMLLQTPAHQPLSRSDFDSSSANKQSAAKSVRFNGDETPLGASMTGAITRDSVIRSRITPSSTATVRRSTLLGGPRVEGPESPTLRFPDGREESIFRKPATKRTRCCGRFCSFLFGF